MRFKKFPVVALLLTLMVSLLAAPPATAKASPKGTASETATLPSKPAKKATAKGKITGKVTFRGKPAKGVRVVAEKAGRQYRAVTNSKGRFSVKAPKGKYKVSALSGKYNAHRTYAGGSLRQPDAKKIKVRPGKTAKARIKLAPAAAVTGRVVDTEGRPVAGVSVDAHHLNRSLEWQDTVTDSKGRYTLKRLPRGKIELGAENYPDQGDTHLTGQVVVRAKAGKKVTAPDLVVSRVPYGVITTEVEWPEDVEYRKVVAHDQVNGGWNVLEQDPTTKLWSAEVRTGSWLVTAAGSNVVTQTVSVTDGATVHAGTVVFPEARGTLNGTVLKKNGKPVTSGQVLIEDALGEYSDHGYITKNGTFTVEGLAPGTHTLHFQPPGDTEKKWGLQALPQPVQVVAGETTAATIKLERGRTVRGKVLHRGKGVKGIAVELWSAPGFSEHYTVTNAKGKFTFKLVARGKYVLEVKDDSPVYRIKTKALTVDGNVKGLRIKIKK